MSHNSQGILKPGDNFPESLQTKRPHDGWSAVITGSSVEQLDTFVLSTLCVIMSHWAFFFFFSNKKRPVERGSKMLRFKCCFKENLNQ